eukprot:scaffold674_cov126-Cylindrotheca_fusiformis.AAC.19
MRLFRSIVSTLLYVVVVRRVLAQDEGNQNALIPASLLASALNYAAQSDVGGDLLEKVYDKDVNALYKVAKSMLSNPRTNTNENDKLSAVQIFHALADGKEHHILSMVQLGFAYSEGAKDQAVKYFVQAGEDGPHQGALYNAGRLFAEERNFAPALGYMRAAVILSKENPGYAQHQMTKTAEEGYTILSGQLQNVDLGLQEMVDMFLYADLAGFPAEGSKAEKLWHAAMSKLRSFSSSGASSDVEAAVKAMSDLQMQYNNSLSELQTSLLRRILVIALQKMNGEL